VTASDLFLNHLLKSVVCVRVGSEGSVERAGIARVRRSIKGHCACEFVKSRKVDLDLGIHVFTLCSDAKAGRLTISEYTDYANSKGYRCGCGSGGVVGLLGTVDCLQI
jgi:hypothetical protein